MKGSVRIPGGYFLKMARHDYHNYKAALPREFFQNSVDAGATKIVVNSDKNARTIDVIDNGCGMDLDVLQNALLVLGGSGKKGKIGVFGKAKELLFFSWESYVIHTMGYQVFGSGAEYQIETTDDHMEGTHVQVTIQTEEDFDSMVRLFRIVATKMDTRADIIIDGQEARRPLRLGKLARDEDWVRIYQLKSYQSDTAPVRVDGIWMFDVHVGSNLGTLVFELNRSSIEVLTSNRDSFKYEYKSKLDKLVEELIINKKSALRKRPDTVYERIPGTGKVKVCKNKIRNVVPFDSSQIDLGAITALMKNEGLEIDEIYAERVQSLDPKLGQEILISKLAFVGYEPDFILKYEGQRRWKDFMETPKARILAHMWTEIVKQVLLDNDMEMEFTAGFTFEPDIEAQRVSVGGEIMFLLNPTNICKTIGMHKAPLSNRKYLVKELRTRACHEVAHCYGKYHDENFILTYHKLDALTWKSDLTYMKIQKLTK